MRMVRAKADCLINSKSEFHQAQGEGSGPAGPERSRRVGQEIHSEAGRQEIRGEGGRLAEKELAGGGLAGEGGGGGEEQAGVQLGPGPRYNEL